MTNVSLTRAGIRKDGTILKASKPLTAVDSTFVPSSKPSGFIGFLPLTTDGDCTSKSPCSPSLGQTHTSIPLTQSYLEALNLNSEKYATWHSLLSMHLASFSPTSDLFPAVSKNFLYQLSRVEVAKVCSNSNRPKMPGLAIYFASGMPDVSSGEPGLTRLELMHGAYFTFFQTCSNSSALIFKKGDRGSNLKLFQSHRCVLSIGIIDDSR